MRDDDCRAFPAVLRSALPFVLTSGVLLLAGGGWARSVLAEGSEAETAPAAFARFERAWRGQDPEAVVACIAHHGRLRLRLFERPFKRDETYTMLADRAMTSLEQYFEDVERLQMVERKPEETRERRDDAGAPGRAPTPTVRTYDYNYRVKGKSPASTRLQVRVAETEAGGWVLESVIELPGREERDENGR
jgi:hypothetical protein